MGSTSIIVIRYDQFLNIINLGDSRCVLCRDNIGISLTKDHKPNWPEEQQRIENEGGKIYYDGDDWRIGDLSVSRAHGDLGANPFVSYLPDIYKYKIDKTDKFIILACDGVWDVLSPQDAVNFVLEMCYENIKGIYTRKNKNINIAKKLGEHSIKMGSGDNITAIIVFYD
jgi:serine/threonine protein phosphatase PrpC